MQTGQFELTKVLPQQKDVLEYILYFKDILSGARKSNIATIQKLSLEDELGEEYMWIGSKYINSNFDTVSIMFRKV